MKMVFISCVLSDCSSYASELENIFFDEWVLNSTKLNSGHIK